MWQDETQVNYFGLGSNSIEDDRSQYRFQTHDRRGYGTYQPKSSLAFSGEFGWLGRPKVLEPGGSFKGDFPDTRDAYPTDPAVSLATQPSLLRSEAAMTADTRDHRGYPTSGFVYRAALTHYMDRSTASFSFREYQAEGLQLIPMSSGNGRSSCTAGRSPRRSRRPRDSVLPAARAGRQQHTARLLELPVSREQSPGRERRVAPASDAAHRRGGVRRGGQRRAPGSPISISTRHRTAPGCACHTTTTTIARMDVAYGDEGWRVVFRTTEPFRLARIRRHVAAMPFMP
jgi:hypothetical protein